MTAGIILNVVAFGVVITLLGRLLYMRQADRVELAEREQAHALAELNGVRAAYNEALEYALDRLEDDGDAREFLRDWRDGSLEVGDGGSWWADWHEWRKNSRADTRAKQIPAPVAGNQGIGGPTMAKKTHTFDSRAPDGRIYRVTVAQTSAAAGTIRVVTLEPDAKKKGAFKAVKDETRKLYELRRSGGRGGQLTAKVDVPWVPDPVATITVTSIHALVKLSPALVKDMLLPLSFDDALALRVFVDQLVLKQA